MLNGEEWHENDRPLVLIVEDEATLAAMLTMMLELEGYASRVVSTGSAALEYLDPPPWSRMGGVQSPMPSRIPGLLLLDLRLGDMDGVDVIRCLRDRGYRVPPVILLSALQRESVASAASEIGAAAYFVKPPDMGELISAVAKVLS